MKKEKVWTYEDLSLAHVNLLRIIAILPFEGRTLSFIGTRILNVYCGVVIVIYNTMYLWPGAKMILDGDVDLGHVCEIVVIQSICIRYVIVFCKREEFARLMGTCRELWQQHVRPEESGTVKAFESKAYLLRSFMLGNGVFTCIVYIATAYFVRLPPIIPNGTATRILPFRFYVDIQEEPMYSIVSVLQSVICFTIAVIIPGIETTGLYLIMMACGYLRCINHRLQSMTGYFGMSSNNDEDKASRLKSSLSKKDVLECARFHQKIMTYCEGIERFTRGVFMTTVICVLYNLSLIAIKLLEKDSDMYRLLAIFVLHSISLFICQWGPEHLLNESKNVSIAAYFATLEHQTFEQTTNKILSIVILRAQKPLHLTAGGYINLSMQTFGSMISNAFSFFTVLRNFSN